MTLDVISAKADLRAAALARRAAAYAAHGAEPGRRLAAHGVDFLGQRAPLLVSGFAAIRDEIDPAPLLDWLHREGFSLALPVMEGRGRPLVMRAFTPGDEMRQVQWGIREPLPDKPEVFPDIVLVPLLAFDAKGYRLGYGGGFYDRTLEKLRAGKPVVAIGVAYAVQEVDSVLHDHHDQLLNYVMTEKELIRCV